MKKLLFICLALLHCAILRAEEDAAPTAREKARNVFSQFGFSVSASGAWSSSGDMSNRLNAALRSPFGFSLRFALADKRPAPPKDGWKDGLTTTGAALYHRPTGSRLVYGPLELWGLAARTRNVWSHAVPYVEAHKTHGADIKSSPSKNDGNSLFFALGSPVLRISSGFSVKVDSSIFVDKNKNLLFHAGSELYIGKNRKSSNKLRFEWAGNSKTLPAYEQSAWFSEKYTTPERKLSFNAYNLTFTNRYFAFSSDFAHSKAFFTGEDIYVNAAIRAGVSADGSPVSGRGNSFPLRVSLAADCAGKSYIASDGSMPGAGFRLGGKAQWLGKGDGMEISASSAVRSAGINKPFTSSDSKVSYTFVRKERFFTMRRVSAEFQRTAADPERIIDISSIYAQANTGPLRPALRFTLAEHFASKSGDTIIIYPYPAAGKTREYFKTDFEVSTYIFFVMLKGTLSHKIDDAGSAGFTLGASASLRGKLGRLSFRISAPQGGSPDYYLSWRIEKSL